MCLNPITIQSNARYYSPFLTSRFNEVSCGRCEECRDARKSTWEDRLCLERLREMLLFTIEISAHNKFNNI